MSFSLAFPKLVENQSFQSSTEELYFHDKPLSCKHDESPSFICRNHSCIKKNYYLSCSNDCLELHLDHPEDLVPFQTFKTYLPQLQKHCSKIYEKLSLKIHESLYKLLHIRTSILQLIDQQIEKLKQYTISYKYPDLKDYIYKIQHYCQKEKNIEFNFELDEAQDLKDIRQILNRAMVKVGNKIRQLLDKGISIRSYENQNNNKSYEFKLEGNVHKVLSLIDTTPEHVDRIKIYLNSEQLILNIACLGTFIENQRVLILLVSLQLRDNTRRIYQESYESLLKALRQKSWLKHITIYVWDFSLEAEKKLDLFQFYRKFMKNVQTFIVGHKLKNVEYQI